MAESTEKGPQSDAPPPIRLEALTDRRRNIRFAPAERAYSRFVHHLRRILPMTALGILGVVMIWPKIETELAQRRFAPSRLDKAALEKAASENRLIGADFSALDSNGRPFSIIAKQAIQKNDDPDTVILEDPRGTLRLNADTTLSAQAKQGLYAQESRHLTLESDVVLTRSDGTTMTTQELFVDLMTNDSHTNMPVAIDGPQGHLTAQGMDMTDGGAVTIFAGPAKLILYSTGDTPNPAPSQTATEPKGKP
ncbi:MAG: LPS export ABC transporter periplasmic protein LptC [Rhodospirillales bacterium]|nr:LPS export ABC transporter periplasmic protein LptC [Alphaproteobacteria bacterium]MCB9986902.1 LPS export ABC transporter periplasmic protein LptC [Rhodospirillales bacterium]USO08320.1 MAG: LPS export ABC transporter periplasmic protein LptC [Rhodospirillales bacterium]